MKTLKFYKITENARIPEFATKDAACFDLNFTQHGNAYRVYTDNNAMYWREFSNNALVITPGDRVMVPTGLIADIPAGFSVRLHPRSGLSLKQGIVLANQEGVIDADFVDEIMVLMTNISTNNVVINDGDRICQGELVENIKYRIAERKTAPKQKTDRDGGFGSTGVQ